MEAALALATELAGKPPVAMRLNKARFREVTEERLPRVPQAAGIRNQREAYATGEPARMMEEFLAKRARAEDSLSLRHDHPWGNCGKPQ
jgi:enoyl-CoA hydratase